MKHQKPNSLIVRLLRAFIAVFIVSSVQLAILGESWADDSSVSIINDRPLSARILGGADAESGQYPSIVALVRPGFNALDQRLFCGGTVVDEKWVLTAAHCVYDAFDQPLQADFVRVVAGITDLAVEVPEAELKVLQIIVHPDYDPSLQLPPNDLALLHVESAISASIATLFAGESADYTDTFGAVAGWGAIEYETATSAKYPTVLQDAFVPLVSNSTCNAAESYDGILANSHLCAGFVDGEIDACAGDSGGPLYLTVNDTQVQVGITSFGIGCGLPLFYGIYTDVSHFIPWLSQYIPVPYQSPELVAQREKTNNQSLAGGGSDSNGDLFAGATGFHAILTMLVMLLVSLTFRHPHRLKRM